ncbi:hypothetical protein PF010_g27528 [Phytophthora fragariae]|nr:hypothetical protein PF010_g27528 [Phytophthora fragariae]
MLCVSLPHHEGRAIAPRVRFTEIKSIQPLSKRSPRAKIVKEYLGVAGGHTQGDVLASARLADFSVLAPTTSSCSVAPSIDSGSIIEHNNFSAVAPNTPYTKIINSNRIPPYSPYPAYPRIVWAI